MGDLAVPRHVKRAVAVVHDRYATYGAALAAEQDDGLLDRAVQARLGTLARSRGLGRSARSART